MVNQSRFSGSTPALLLVAGLLLPLAGCTGYVESSSARTVYVEPPVQTVYLEEDDYVYYPSYNVYYSSRRHHYYYQDRGAWVTRSSPRSGLSANLIFASPSVRMDFHDSPSRHHADVIRRYPPSWSTRNNRQDRRQDTRQLNRQPSPQINRPVMQPSRHQANDRGRQANDQGRQANDQGRQNDKRDDRKNNHPRK